MNITKKQCSVKIHFKHLFWFSFPLRTHCYKVRIVLNWDCGKVDCYQEMNTYVHVHNILSPNTVKWKASLTFKKCQDSKVWGLLRGKVEDLESFDHKSQIWAIFLGRIWPKVVKAKKLFNPNRSGLFWYLKTLFWPPIFILHQ